MEEITVRHLTFSYGKSSTFFLQDVSFDVKKGELLLITGESGCGKTTLLRHLKNAYIPQGNRTKESRIFLQGIQIEELDDRQQAALVGFVGQHTQAAQVTDKVWHELVFGLESLGYSQDFMQKRAAEMTAFFGLEQIFHEKLSNLSGGQRQLVNLASVMAMEPDILVLDEPTSQLDPIASTEFFRMIDKIHREIGTTIVMTEHRLSDVFPMCDRVMVLHQGSVVFDGSPCEAVQYLYDRKMPLFRGLPAAARISLELGETGSVPLTVNEGRKWLFGYLTYGKKRLTEYQGISVQTDRAEVSVSREKNTSQVTHSEGKHGNVPLHAKEVWFRYEKEGRDILRACSLAVPAGKITAILGGNGAGKSTLLQVLAGHQKPYLGKVVSDGCTVGFLPQNPQAMFAAKTVKEELQMMHLGKEVSLSKSENALIDFFDLREVLDQHPFDLSGGQMEKLALAKLVQGNFDVLLLDEPGKGMDYAFKEKLGTYLKKLAEMGKTIVLVSHDVEFCASYADRCGLFFDGHIVSLMETKSFFLQNVFYTTSVCRICRGMLEAVLVEEVLDILRNRMQGRSEKENGVVRSEERTNTGMEQSRVESCGNIEIEQEGTGSCENVCGKRTSIPVLIFLVIMPLTIFLGHTVLHQRKYYFISLVLILEGIAALFLGFEHGKPKIREMMTIAVMSAVTAMGRAAFYMVPAVKPMAALTIISGIGLGGEAGFLVGALSMLVSDIFFGQGPWTPWQMFTMGLIGLLAGGFRKEGAVWTKKRRAVISVFGLLVVLVLYGGIMNPASVLMYQEHVTWSMIVAAYAVGFPIDCIHGVATFFFLWFGAQPMLEKLERVRKK